MPTVAETQLAAVAAWFAASSKATTSPLGDPIIRGPYASLVSVGIDDAGADVESLVSQGVLPVFTPQAVSTGFDLIPGATHWFERDGDIECSTIWANSVLSSVTRLHMAGEARTTGDAYDEGDPS
jgi:hypothetical protein